ncbi:Putative enoyl-CoA hydratase/isomerase, ClpP/crotonase-like domain superfamily [Colletotrichum destructivum]|uniref:Enoyl-CoA hydratase/isomerase, ClpP/crotonase-like domain superfamily n=1 Tax=Colletotrichum destructivum TaxID=34406 RepID=A0AAX4J1A9_9PEZI|nr:Putative enoyl-CoA hydratase/isomerase, ClpP/crotonase-like domain superfamily [Colletotrichum destructivum]
MPLLWLTIQALAGLLFSKAVALDLPKYEGLVTSQNNSILTITLHNPVSSVNAWSADMHAGMKDIVRRLQEDNETKVVIINSSVPRFFCNHFDPAVFAIANFTEDYAMLMMNITNLPQITIGAVEGRARNAGHELLLALDMRFATTKDVLIGETETAFGNFPVAGSCQHLPRLIGRGLAMEYILSSQDVDAKEAERIGWINKAFDSRRDMYSHIDKLTSRLALFPRSGLVASKQAINLRSKPSREDFLHDITLFQDLSNPDFARIVDRVATLTNNWTAGEVELNLGRDVVLAYN